MTILQILIQMLIRDNENGLKKYLSRGVSDSVSLGNADLKSRLISI